ncbi:MAG: hypothetical protein KDH88_19760 [Chromatiales bacterium]|nr:hypothetical protein [Chromatiales bacterium]
MAPARGAFDHARDPLISAQLKAQAQTEHQRRQEAAGRGSTMVARHKPFPELRPRRERAVVRAAFNQAWLKEQREAGLAQIAAREAQNSGPQREAAIPSYAPRRER